MLKFFKNILSFRTSRQKAASTRSNTQERAYRAPNPNDNGVYPEVEMDRVDIDFDPRDNTVYPEDLNIYQKDLMETVVTGTKIAEVFKLKEAGITGDAHFEHGDTVSTFAIKMLEMRRAEEQEAINSFHKNHWEGSAVLDKLSHYESNEHLRAAAFLHSKSFLQNLKDLPQEDYPQFTINDYTMQNMHYDQGVINARAAHNNASFIVMDILGAKDASSTIENLKKAKANSLGETPSDLFEFYINNNNQAAAAAELASNHIAGAMYVQDILDQGANENDLQQWANDPILQRDFPLLKRYATMHYDADYYAKLEEDALNAASQQEQEAALVSQVIDIIQHSDVDNKNLFADQDVNPHTELQVENGTVTFLIMATEVYGARLNQELNQIERLGEFHADSFDFIRDTIDSENMHQELLLAHEPLLAAMGIPEEEWPMDTIKGEALKVLVDAKTNTAKAEQILRATMGIDDDASIDKSLQAIAEDNVYAGHAYNMHCVFENGTKEFIKESKIEPTVIDIAAALEHKAQEIMADPKALEQLRGLWEQKQAKFAEINDFAADEVAEVDMTQEAEVEAVVEDVAAVVASEEIAEEEVVADKAVEPVTIDQAYYKSALEQSFAENSHDRYFTGHTVSGDDYYNKVKPVYVFTK